MAISLRKPFNYPLLIAVILAIIVFVYTSNRYEELRTVYANLDALDVTIEQLVEAQFKSDRALAEVKNEVNEVANIEAQKLNAILPTDEDITNLTRRFDEFAAENHFSNNPFFINSINFGNAEESPGGKLMFVPVNLSIQSSRTNFFKFLEFIEGSGSLENEVRLMRFNRIDLRLPKLGDEDQSFNYQVELYSYYKKP